jgi:hypothetical protein
VNDLCNSRHRNVQIERKPIHAELKGFHKLHAQNLARMDGRKAFLRLSHEFPLVIVDDLYVVGVPFSPSEAQAPLVVDPDAVLSLSAAMQGFQAISRWRPQVTQIGGAVQLPKFSPCNALDGPKTSARLTPVKSPGFGGAERLNHQIRLTRLAFNVKRYPYAFRNDLIVKQTEQTGLL